MEGKSQASGNAKKYEIQKAMFLNILKCMHKNVYTINDLLCFSAHRQLLFLLAVDLHMETGRKTDGKTYDHN